MVPYMVPLHDMLNVYMDDANHYIIIWYTFVKEKIVLPTPQSIIAHKTLYLHLQELKRETSYPLGIKHSY